MSKIFCYSVRLQSLVSVSDKAYKATSFDGSSDILPKSQVINNDYEVNKSDAYWISAWILEKKNIQYSRKKSAWLDKNTGRILPKIEYKHHTPKKKYKTKIEHDNSLFK